MAAFGLSFALSMGELGATVMVYPPGWVTWNEGFTSCDSKHWCAALNIDSYNFDPNNDEPQPASNSPLGWEVTFTLPPGATDPNALIAAQGDGKLIVAGQAPVAGLQQIFVARLFGLSRVYASVLAQRVKRTARSLRVRLSCTPSESCVGTAALTVLRHGRRVALGTAHFDVFGTGVLTIELNRTGRAYLGGRRAKRVTLTLTLLNGPTHTTRITVPGRR